MDMPQWLVEAMEKSGLLGASGGTGGLVGFLASRSTFTIKELLFYLVRSVFIGLIAFSLLLPYPDAKTIALMGAAMGMGILGDQLIGIIIGRWRKD